VGAETAIGHWADTVFFGERAGDRANHPRRRGGRRGRRLLRIVALAIALAAVLGLKSSAFAAGASFTVTSTADAVDANVGNGLCATSAGVCTLRAAIQETNALAGPDTIVVPGGTYAITRSGTTPDTGDYDIADSVTIAGAGASATIIDGGNPAGGGSAQMPGIDRLFEVVAEGATISISDLTLSGGWAAEYGGAILNSSSATMAITGATLTGSVAGKTGGAIDNHVGGTVSVSDSTLSNNYAAEGGSAINNNLNGTLTIANSTISSNSAADVGLNDTLVGAGAISNNAEHDELGTIAVTDSLITENRAGSGKNGAGISNDGTGIVTVSETTFTKNVAQGDGGAIYNVNGQVTVTGSAFSENAAKGGGAIASVGDGFMTVRTSSFSKNDAVDEGGATMNGNKGSFAISDSTFTENTALNGGGFGNEGSGLVTVDDSTFTKNTAFDAAILTGGEGGGMYSSSSGEVIVTSSTFTENHARDGGGLANEGGGQTTITSSSFTANKAEEAGGGILIQAGAVRMVDIDVLRNTSDALEEGGGGISYAGDKAALMEDSAALESSRILDNKAKGQGGGIDSRGDGPLVITTTRIAGNTALAGGAIHHVGDAPLAVTRSTLSGNAADNGGGVFVDGDGEALLENTTISANRASQFGGGVLVSSRINVRHTTVVANLAAQGGGINNGGGDLIGDGFVFLASSIVASNPTGGNCAGTITSNGGNVENSNTCQLVELSDQPGTNPLLGPLASNGGPTQTHALLAGSPAQDRAICTELDPCPPVDQRGVARPVFTNADAGAYESELAPGGGGPPACVGPTERPVLADFDTWVSQSSANGNFGADAILDVSQGERALVHFTLPAAPPGCDLVGATLRVFAASATGGRTLEAVRIAAPWSEFSTTWNNQPATSGTAAPTPSGLGVREWDVLAQTQAMYAQGSHGFLIRDQGESGAGQQSFHSREKGTDPPELVLLFDDPDAPPTVPPGDCPTNSQLVNADRDSWVSQGSPSNNAGNDSTLKVKSQSGSNSRALIRFPLPPLPPGCTTVAAAALRVTIDSVKEGRTLEALQLGGAWTESGVTWANQPAAVGPAAALPTAAGVVEWAVTSQVLNMYTSANNGFVIRDRAENGTGDEQSINSREKATDGPPVLVIAFDGSTPETSLDAGPLSPTVETTASFTFSSDRDDATFECSLDGAAYAACTSPLSVPDLAEGTHLFEVRATRKIRAIDPTPATHTWTVAIPPVTTISGPESPSAVANATLIFEADDPEATFECALDAPAFEPCTSPVGLEGLSDGSHAFSVRATDPLGNAEPDPPTHTWLVAVPPETAIDSSPPALTNVAAASFEFSAVDNGPASALVFACSLDGAEYTTCASPAEYDALGDGLHTFSVRATDAAGNADASAADYAWTVDTTPPETTITLSPSALTNSADASFEFTSNEEGTTFACSLDEAPFTNCDSPASYMTLEDGEHTFAVRATDAAANTDASTASFAWTVDTTPPETTIAVAPPALTNAADASFELASSEPGSSFACSLDGAELGSCGSAALYAELADGEHTFAVRATDAAGNTDASAAIFSWTIDTVAPDTTITSAPATLTNDSSPELAFESTEEGSSLACSLDAAEYVACTSAVLYAELADGEHTFAVRATDAAGNADPSAASVTWSIDTIAPETSITGSPLELTNSSGASFSFASTELGSSFACSLDEGAPTSCTSPTILAGLADGPHSFSVRATDATGNVDASAASYAWTIDTVAPETAIDSGPEDPGNDSTPTFTFSASESATFRCSLDEEPLVACTSPVTSSVLAEGEHTFFVEATDAAGNVEAEAAAFTFVVDVTAPETSIGLGPNDPGNDSTPTFTFTASEEASFRCSVDESPFASCTSPFTTGELGEGAHSVSVEATDAAGNVEPAPAIFVFTVDLTAPDTAITDGPVALTNASGASFSFSATEGGSSFSCSLDGAAAVCASAALYTELADGAHTFSVTATDAAGNVDASPAVRIWTIDTVAPETSIDAGPDDPGNDSTPTFAFSVSEDAAFRCSVDEAPFESCTSPLTTGELVDGAHSFSVRATDAAGNVEADPASFAFTVDLTAPETTITIGPSALTNDSSAGFSFTSTEPGSGFTCSLDGEVLSPCTSGVSYAALAEGPHSFSVIATDAAGNADGSAATRSWTIDTVAPETSITDSPLSLTNDSDASFAFTSTEPGSSFTCSLDGSPATSCASAASYAGLADGTHTFSVRAADAAGNADASAAAFTWRIDTAPPLTSIVTGPPETTTETTATFELQASELDATFECALDGGAFAACVSPHEIAGLALGSHELEARATDAAGNTDATPASHAWTVQAADTTAPETTITLGPPTATNDATPTFEFEADEPSTFLCRVDSAAFAECTSPHATAALSQGAHTFEVRATDAVGLTDATPASRAFTVDTVAPQTTITNGPPATTTSATAQFEFTSTETGSSFECSLDGASFSPCSSPTTYTVAVGSHAFEVLATDAAGNTDDTSASRAWTVNTPDTTAPETTIAAGPSGATNDATPTFEFSADESATFQCRVDSAAFAECTSPHTTAALSQGAHAFEVRATDPTGNTDTSPASRSFTVDTVAPQTTITNGPPTTTSSATVQFEFTSSETASSFQCSLDGASFSPCSSPTTYTVAFGSHAFEVRATDAAGNTDGTSASRAWTVQAADSTPPETTITAGPTGPTNDTTPTFEFTANETATFQCRVDAASFAPCSSPHTTSTLSQGAHAFEVRATDSAGLTDASPASRSITVDTAAPQTTITAGPPATTSSTAAQFEFTSTETGSSFECSLDGAAFASCTSPATYTVALGSHQFQVRARDAAGNLDQSPASASWTVQAGDSTPPETTITGGPTGPTNDPTPTFTFSSSESGSTFQCRVDTAAFANCTTPHTTATLAQGAHTFEVRARDAAGNVDLTPASRSITVDTAAPQTTITAGPTGPTNDTTPTFEFSASETATFQCRVNSAAFASCSSPHTTAVLGSGSHTFQVRAIDSAGTMDSTPASRAFTIDTAAPNTTITQAPPATTSNATVSFQFSSSETGSSFECSLDGSGFVPCASPVSYTVSPGTHQFQVRARDAAGNTDASPASASWTYQAADTTPPDTTITTGPPATTTNATVSFEFTSTETGSSFECSLDGSGFAPCSSPVSYTVSVGPHQFQVRARDASGNVDQSPASRSWTREQPPAGSCTTSTATLGAAADSWLLESSATSNYGSDSVLKVDSKSGGNARALVRFSLPAIPAGCQVVDARLRLYAGSYKTGRTIDAYAVTTSWTESSVSWASQPAPVGPAAGSASGDGYREWNVTGQLASTYPSNTGFLVRDRTEGGGGVEQGYNSREKGTDNPPRLVITFG
jgi:CSLREA domain-containing protein